VSLILRISVSLPLPKVACVPLLRLCVVEEACTSDNSRTKSERLEGPTQTRIGKQMTMGETAAALFALLLAAMGFVALVMILSPTPAGAIECKPAPSGGSYQAWRLIDGRKCWYRGERVPDKSELHWPPKDGRFTAPRTIGEQKQPIYSFVDPLIENEIDRQSWYEASPISPPILNTWSGK